LLHSTISIYYDVKYFWREGEGDNSKNVLIYFKIATTRKCCLPHSFVYYLKEANLIFIFKSYPLNII